MSHARNIQQKFSILASGEWAAKASLASVLRSLTWALFFFWLIGKLLQPAPTPSNAHPYGPQLADTVATPITTSKSDPKGFRRDIPPKTSGNFRIGWIGGSELHTRSNFSRKKSAWDHESFVPVEVAERLGKIDGKKPEVALYLLSGQRIFDSYLCMLDAIDRGSDLIIISLNPVWALNSKAITLWTNLYSGVIPAVLDDPATLWSIALLGGPRQIAEGAIASVFDAVLTRFDASVAIGSNASVTPHLNNSRTLKQNPETLQYLDIFSKSQPLQFWVEHEKWGGHSENRSATEWQWAAISYSADEGGVLPAAIINQMVEHLRDSGIPSLIYVAPIEYQALKHKTIESKVDFLEEYLITLNKNYEGTNIRVVSDNPSRFIKGLPFHDMVHLQRSEKLSDFLTDEINILLGRNSEVKRFTKEPSTGDAIR